ncbi:MFS transporter [Saxibacter everestensis]|uniref:MFS transporter n=1 Tax=Saxibacter everestensis TaxID=2909229 RepID=A0ABY8QYW1_9MICO|nr:MFS transporter [Brevibacteriaceae bacterium ZFBP1038]
MANHVTSGSAPKGATADEPEAPMTHRQVLEALTGLLAALFTAILSSTIVANALPTIMSELKGTQTDFAWVITASLLANAATTPIWGKLADLFNKKVLVQLSIVIFVGGSVLAGLSDSIPMLLTARVIQGVAMGGLTALAQAVIGTMIPPRERGRYSGYMGAVMAVATAGGPLLGGFIVDSSLGWRWTFFVCVPLAVVALILLQLTLKLKHVRRPAKIDWLGSLLLTAGVSLLLIWVSFAGKDEYYDWISHESLLMVGGSVVLLLLLLLVEAKVSHPIIPLKIISQRTTALAIIASIAVGVAMFASSSYLGQYYQLARGATPTEAGLLTMPMIAGNLIGAVVSGQLVSRFGKWKRFLVMGSVLLIAGLGFAGTIDHATHMWLVGLYTFVFGLGLGLLMQNLVLAVQNTVAVKDIGSASASVAFFRSVGGAVGVSVLGAILGTHVSDLTTTGLNDAGIPASAAASGSGASMDLGGLPDPIAEIVRAAYGDGTALIFSITAGVAVLAFISVLFIKEQALRRTIDIRPDAEHSPADAATSPADAEPADAELADAATSPTDPEPENDLDREFADVLSGRAGAGESRQFRMEPERRAALRNEDLSESAQRAEADAQLELATQLQATQRLLGAQQLQLSEALHAVGEQAAQQRDIAERQAKTAERLTALEADLARERQLQQAAAHYLASRQSELQSELQTELQAEQ